MPDRNGAPPLTTDQEQVFPGDSELAYLMRALDWSRTPLGPVAGWPQALKTCVHILLTSRQPMWLGWGEQLTYLYNDPYKSIIGGKHPWALGRPTAEVWREIWEDIGPRIRTTMEGKEGTYDEALLLIMERHGYPEETYYTFSYSPVPDERGGVGGLFCANSDDTQRIVGERQLTLLRELAVGTADTRSVADACVRSARALETNPHDLPFALLYLLDPDRRQAVLAGTANMQPGHPAAPAVAPLDGPSPWPFAAVIGTNAPVLIPDLPSSFGGWPAGPWERPPSQAVALPIAPAGQTGQAGILVVGLNPYRLFNDDYQRFLGLVAGQVAAAIGNAQAYEEERRRAEALAELDRAKTAFFSNISHEFRTPLTLLLGPVEDLLAGVGGELAPRQREELTVAHRNSLRLLRLVNMLLDFSRLEAGRIQATYEPTDVPALTADLASSFDSAVARAGLRLIVDCPPLPADVEVYVDRDMWEKIVLNLLSNALKFTFAGEIAVQVRPSEDRRAVTLAVRDTGTGIAAEELPHLFERFRRIEGARARTHEGTGIGLALVQELVRLHGGTVTVASAVGEGTTFDVTIPTGKAHLPAERLGPARTLLPAAPGATPFVEEALRWLPDDDGAMRSVGDEERSARMSSPSPFSPSPHLPIPPSPRPAGRILLADDSADMRAYVLRLLAPHYAVEAVTNGAEALAAALARPPDLVLSDVMMPEMDGVALLHALRAEPRTRAVPVVLLSARAGEEATVEGVEAGADDYLVKPFAARELLARIGAHLELARVRAEATEREHAARVEVQRQREDFYAMLMQAPVPICVIAGPDLVFELANPAYIEVVGGRNILGQPLLAALPEAHGQGYDDFMRAVMRTGKPVVRSESLVKLVRDGELQDLYFTFIYAPLRNPEGVADRVIAVVNEVTDQVRARQAVEAEVAERKRAEVLLAGQRAVLELIAEGRPIGQTLEALVRFIEAQADGARCSILLLSRDGVHLRHGAAPSLPEAYNRAIDGLAIGPAVGSCGTAAYRNEPVVVSDIAADPLWADYKDLAGTHGLRACWSTPIRAADGRVLGTFAVYRREPGAPSPRERRLIDVLTYLAGIAITRHQGEEERTGLLEREQAARTEAEMAVRDRDDFLAAASHDLKNPLAAIKGTVQLLERGLARTGTVTPERLRAALASIGTSTAQMTAQMDELLDVARLQSGRPLPLERRSIDLVALAQQAVTAEQQTTEHHRLRLETELEGLIGDWDGPRLTRVLANLLANAIKYSPDGGEIVVTIGRDGAEDRDPRPGPWAVLSVRDHGVGIPASELPRIFERFQRGSNVADRITGSGLGLASAKQIVEAQRGTIRIESREGEGTLVTVRLPLGAPAAGHN